MNEVLDFLDQFKPQSRPASSEEPPENPENLNAVPEGSPDWEGLADSTLDLLKSSLEPRLGCEIEFSLMTRRALASCAEASGAAYFSKVIAMIQANYPVVMLGIFSVSVFLDIRRAKLHAESLHSEERGQIHQEQEGPSEVHQGTQPQTQTQE